MSKAKSSFTSQEFEALLPKFRQALTFELERELAACALPELGGQPASGLWDLPTVDSKTVCKLSPIVKNFLDRRLEPSWVKKGGYESVEAAVQDIVAHARQDCIREASPVPAASPLPAPVQFRRQQ
jgi:hypothetical protein